MNKENTKGNALKKDDASMLGKLQVHYQNGDAETLEFVRDVALSSLQQFYKGELKRHYQVAQAITEAMVEKKGGAWHTIVGKSYGSFVTHEDKNMFYFSIGPVLILTFKHG